MSPRVETAFSWRLAKCWGDKLKPCCRNVEAAGVASRDENFHQTRQHQQQTATHVIALVAYVSIHLQDSSQQGKRDIKTTWRVCYLACSQAHAGGGPSSLVSVVLLPSDATGHPELALALRLRGKATRVQGILFLKELVKANTLYRTC